MCYGGRAYVDPLRRILPSDLGPSVLQFATVADYFLAEDGILGEDARQV